MNNKKKIIAWLLFIFWLLLIFFFSQQNGVGSSSLSNGFLAEIEKLIHIPLNNDVVRFIIRKLAHFTEYFILAILTCNLVKEYFTLNKKQYILIMLFCIFYAFSDEFHQLFISGRSGQIKDVLIDSSGSLVGLICYYFIKNKKRKIEMIFKSKENT